jgi:hypothetical protein
LFEVDKAGYDVLRGVAQAAGVIKYSGHLVRA